MQITDFVKPSGTFLKAEEVKGNPNATFIITDEPVIIEGEFKGKPTQRLHAEGEFNKEPRIFDMSKTNARLVAKVLGDDTSKWIGHNLFLETYKTKTSDGKLTDAINVKEAK
jgi:hypothetical protein